MRTLQRLQWLGEAFSCGYKYNAFIIHFTQVLKNSEQQNPSLSLSSFIYGLILIRVSKKIIVLHYHLSKYFCSIHSRCFLVLIDPWLMKYYFSLIWNQFSQRIIRQIILWTLHFISNHILLNFLFTQTWFRLRIQTRNQRSFKLDYHFTIYLKFVDSNCQSFLFLLDLTFGRQKKNCKRTNHIF